MPMCFPQFSILTWGNVLYISDPNPSPDSALSSNRQSSSTRPLKIRHPPPVVGFPMEPDPNKIYTQTQTMLIQHKNSRWCSYMRVPTYTHTHAHVFACTHKHAYIYLLANIYTPMHMYIHAKVYIHMHACIFLHMYIFTYTYSHVHNHTSQYVPIHIRLTRIVSGWYHAQRKCT